MKNKTQDNFPLKIGGQYWLAQTTIEKPMPARYTLRNISFNENVEVNSMKTPSTSIAVASTTRRSRRVQSIINQSHGIPLGGNSSSSKYASPNELPPISVPSQMDESGLHIVGKKERRISFSFSSDSDSQEICVLTKSEKLENVFYDYKNAMHKCYKDLMLLGERIQDASDQILEILQSIKDDK